MRAFNIEAFITANKLRGGDVIQIEQPVLGLNNHYLGYVGTGSDGRNLFAGKVDGQIYWIGEQSAARVFQASPPTRIHRFQGSETQRATILQRLKSNLNEDTFGLMLNWAMKPKQQTQSNPLSDASTIAGGILLGAAFVALLAALFSKDEE